MFEVFPSGEKEKAWQSLELTTNMVRNLGEMERVGLTAYVTEGNTRRCDHAHIYISQSFKEL